MVIGPWGVAKFSTSLCPLFTADAKELDKDNNGGRTQIRSEEKDRNNVIRDSEEGRGLTALQQADINGKKRALDIDHKISQNGVRVSKKNELKETFEMYVHI
jgi:hypothetical protein